MADDKIVTKKTAAKPAAATKKQPARAPAVPKKTVAKKTVASKAQPAPATTRAAPQPARPAAKKTVAKKTAAKAPAPAARRATPPAAPKPASPAAAPRPATPAPAPKSAAPTPRQPDDPHPDVRRLATLSPEERLDMIRETAYYIAERRHFAPGNEAQDWADAETEVDELIGRAKQIFGD